MSLLINKCNLLFSCVNSIQEFGYFIWLVLIQMETGIHLVSLFNETCPVALLQIRLSNDAVIVLEVHKNSIFHRTNLGVVHSDVAPHKNKNTVALHSQSHSQIGTAKVPEIIFEQVLVYEVEDFIVHGQSVHGDTLAGLDFDLFGGLNVSSVVVEVSPVLVEVLFRVI